MKAALLLSLILTVSACGGGGDDLAPPSPKPAVNMSMFAQSDASLVAKYNLNDSQWSSPVVADEPIFSGDFPKTLWRAPNQVYSVRNRITGQIYEVNTDWTVNGAGQVILAAGTTIPVATTSFLSTIAAGTPAIWNPYKKNGSPLRIAADYQQNQLAVTYRAGVNIADPLVFGSVPIAASRISKGLPLAITFYGDSITAGADSTESLNIYPMQPGWPKLLASMIGASWRNQSIGGLGSAELKANIQTVSSTPSDLVLLAQGMNDAVAGVSGAQYEENIRDQITAVRAIYPETEFVLVAPWMGNPDWAPININLIEDYRQALIRIAGNTAGVSVADVSGMSYSILATKKYEDVTSNGVNHPNDWMHIIYAQVVRKSIH